MVLLLLTQVVLVASLRFVEVEEISARRKIARNASLPQMSWRIKGTT